MEPVFFRKQWAKYKPLLNVGELYAVKGQQRADRGISVLVEDIYSEMEISRLDPHVTVRVDAEIFTEAFAGAMFSVFGQNRGKHEVILKLVSPEQTVVSLLKKVTVEPGDKLEGDIAEMSSGMAVCEH